MDYINNFINHPDFYKYIAIPFIAALVGWGTNWVAINLTFYPIRFIGIPPYLGWQGIIPRNGEKMARIVVNNTLQKISNMREMFDQFEPETIAQQIIQVYQYRTEEFVDSIMLEQQPVLWENLPQIIKHRIYLRTREQIPRVIEGMMADMYTHIEELIDPQELIVKQLVADKQLLNRVFQECGEQEFKLVINSGLWLGFLFGLVQMLVWFFYQAGWVLPFFGFIVGIATNWLALFLIFRPLNPLRINLWPLGHWVIQGLFLKRQQEVAQTFSRLVASDMLTVDVVMKEIFFGCKAQHSQMIIRKNLRPLLAPRLTRTAFYLGLGPGAFASFKKAVQKRSLDLSLLAFEDRSFIKERSIAMEKLFCSRMQAMTAAEFQDLLRPAFQEDELILILVGGALGLAAGLAQWLYLFAGYGSLV